MNFIFILSSSVYTIACFVHGRSFLWEVQCSCITTYMNGMRFEIRQISYITQKCHFSLQEVFNSVFCFDLSYHPCHPFPSQLRHPSPWSNIASFKIWIFIMIIIIIKSAIVSSFSRLFPFLSFVIFICGLYICLREGFTFSTNGATSSPVYVYRMYGTTSKWQR